jgi:hypothetical protein
MRVPAKKIIVFILIVSLYTCVFNLHSELKRNTTRTPITADISYSSTVPTQFFTEYGTCRNSSTNVEFSNSTPGDAYLDIPPQWRTDFLNVSVLNLLENRTWTNNSQFDVDASGWTYFSRSNGELTPWGGWANDSLPPGRNSTFVILRGNYSSEDLHYHYRGGQAGRWEQKITIPRGQVIGAIIECDLYVQYAFINPLFEIFFEMDSNNTENQILALTDFRYLKDNIVAGPSWFHVKFPVDPLLFDLEKNNTIYFSYGLGFYRSSYVDGGFAGTGKGYNAANQTVYFDNVALTLMTRALPSDVNLTVKTNDISDTVKNITPLPN